MYDTGRKAVFAATALAMATAALAGAGLLPQAASALPVNPTGGRTGTTTTVSAPQTAEPTPQTQAPVAAVAESKAADLRDEPSGLEAVDARTAGRRTPTAISKSAKVAAFKAYRAELAAKSAVRPVGPWKTGKVSWYGPGFYGNTMAGGGTLYPTSMVVAHRSLPFGTKIQFSYKGKICVAVVKDRGPYVSGRVFDLGPGTAKALGFSGVGTISYRIVK